MSDPSARDSAADMSVPPGVRVYAIGDVHGRADLLAKIFGGIDAHLRNKPVDKAIEVLIGDYIDRGPDSRQVVEQLIARSRNGRTVCLMGNHELFLQRFLQDDPAVVAEWGRYGGLETLLSYGLSPSLDMSDEGAAALAAELAKSLPDQHRRFFSELKPSFTCGDYYFVHAGVRPEIPLDEQSDDDLFWIRDEFLAYTGAFEKRIVHGHTPVRDIDFRFNRINIDTGAYITGRLSCLILEGSDVFAMQTGDGGG